MPGVALRIPDRLRHLVFVSCMVPGDGCTAEDMFDEQNREVARRAPADVSQPLAPDVARAWFGNDMDEGQFTFMAARLVPEALGTTRAPVSLAGLANDISRTWVRLLRDQVLPVERQERFRSNARARAV